MTRRRLNACSLSRQRAGHIPRVSRETPVLLLFAALASSNTNVTLSLPEGRLINHLSLIPLHYNFWTQTGCLNPGATKQEVSLFSKR